MRTILLNLEVIIYSTNSNDSSIKVKPDFVFSGEFDKDDSESFKAMCDLEYKVANLAKSFEALGYNVSCLRKEFSHLDIG